jgi:hypothetical protein
MSSTKPHLQPSRTTQRDHNLVCAHALRTYCSRAGGHRSVPRWSSGLKSSTSLKKAPRAHSNSNDDADASRNKYIHLVDLVVIVTDTNINWRKLAVISSVISYYVGFKSC